MNISMVWTILPPGPIGYEPYIGTHHLHEIVNCDYTFWPEGRGMPNLSAYDVLIVNLFEDMTHVEAIKRAYPRAWVIALPDSYFDEVFLQRDRGSEARFIRQLKAADMIAYVSESNRQFYSAFNKPMVKIPMPIGTPTYFEDARKLPKQEYIITCDHSPRIVDYTIQNVMTVAQIQKATGLRVIYVNEGAFTPWYAEQFGLKAEFMGYVEFPAYVRMAAQARLGVDMYARHGFGRNELMYAYAGTPFVSGNYTHEGRNAQATPFSVDFARELAINLIEDSPYRDRQIKFNLQKTETWHSEWSIRSQWALIEQELAAYVHVPV